jgi:hypothetical protein
VKLLLVIVTLVAVALAYLLWIVDVRLCIGGYFLTVISATVAVRLYLLLTGMFLRFRRNHSVPL